MSNKLKLSMYDLIATFVASNKLKLCDCFQAFVPLFAFCYARKIRL
jgi:hypothetical protein